MNTIETLNRAVFLHINGGAGTPLWLVRLAVFLANGLIVAIPLLLVALWLCRDAADRGRALRAFLTAMAALALNQAIIRVWFHPRPFMLGLGHTWMAHAPDSSFPSDHATVFAAVGLALLFGGAWRTAALVLTAGLAVAWARVFLGVHFPLDMIGAVLVAGVACGVIFPVWQRWGEPLLSLAECAYRLLFAWPISRGWLRR